MRGFSAAGLVACAAALSWTGQALADDLVAAVLPSSRSPVAGHAATAFATVINVSGRDLSGCSVTLPGFSGTFTYRTTDSATNASVGGINQTFALAAGASQSLLISASQNSSLTPTDEHLVFQCAGSGAAASIIGVDTLLLSVGAAAQPDIVALAATSSGDGTVRMAGIGQTQAFAIASVNVGTASAITVTADTGDVVLPMQIAICETNPATGSCLNPPAASVRTTIAANATPTFSVFTTAQAAIPFFPSVFRLSIRFKDGNGAVRGATSVALSTGSSFTAGQSAGGYYLGTIRITSGQALGQTTSGAFLISEDGELRGVSYNALNGSSITSLFKTQVAPASSLLYTANGTIFAASGYALPNGVTTAPLSLFGAVSPRGFVGGTFSLPGETGAFYGSYQTDIYERSSSLGTVSGKWTLRDGAGNAAGSLQVNANGTFSGTDLYGCGYNGSLSVIDARYNAYRISLTVTNCTSINGSYTGLGGLFDKRSRNDAFQFDLSSGTAIETNYITRY